MKTTWVIFLALLPGVCRCQITPEQANAIRAGIGDRIEALAILAGDLGLSGGKFTSDSNPDPGQSATHTVLDVVKSSGSGTLGDPRPLGDLNIGWQPQLLGAIGHLESTNLLREGLRSGDSSVFKSSALEFGGGIRFWLSDHFSLAPTLTTLYGRTSNTYTAHSAFMITNLTSARQLGLVDWSVDSWTLRPALDLQYVFTVGRDIITLTSDPTLFYTRSLKSSNPYVQVNGESSALVNTIDMDIPTGIELWGHELRSGGYFSHTRLSGGLSNGLGTQYMNEIHGRLVLDFLNQFWSVQWLGLGASYSWGANISGWSAGVDVTFRF